MSDTPRTDAMEVDFYNGTSCICHVPSVLARELERELAELKRENARLQMELDASCNAEELRQYRHANQFLIINQGAYERENARMKKVLEKISNLPTDQLASPEQCVAVVLAMDALSELPNVRSL